jgi:hypothetical protein
MQLLYPFGREVWGRYVNAVLKVAEMHINNFIGDKLN